MAYKQNFCYTAKIEMARKGDTVVYRGDEKMTKGAREELLFTI